MKKLFKLLFLSLFLVSFSSCSDDAEQLIVSAKGSGEITAPQSGFTQILNPEENQSNTAFTLTWNPADFDLPTKITYNVEFAKSGTDFADAFIASTTTNTYLTWNISEFNGVVINAGLLPFAEGSLDVRVVATVGTQGSIPQASELITITITPFTTDLPRIAVPGNHQGWDPPTAPQLAASAFGLTDYEGFVWLLDGTDVNNGDGFKFLAPDQTGGFFWGNTDWADDGTYTATSDGTGIGTLIEDDEVNCTVDMAGYYLVRVNPSDSSIEGFLNKKTMAYSTTLTSWGIIGNATPTGWDSDTDMIYDPVTRTLSITLDLVQQDAPDNGIKFRANDAWDINIGDDDADGTMEFGGQNIGVPQSGNYTVTLDLSNPRAYTYSLVKN